MTGEVQTCRNFRSMMSKIPADRTPDNRPPCIHNLYNPRRRNNYTEDHNIANMVNVNMFVYGRRYCSSWQKHKLVLERPEQRSVDGMNLVIQFDSSLLGPRIFPDLNYFDTRKKNAGEGVVVTRPPVVHGHSHLEVVGEIFCGQVRVINTALICDNMISMQGRMCHGGSVCGPRRRHD